MCQDGDAFLTRYGDASLRICVKTKMRQKRRCVQTELRQDGDAFLTQNGDASLRMCVKTEMRQKRRCFKTEMRHSEVASKAEMRHYEDVSRRRCVFDSIRRCVITDICQDGDASI